MQFAVQEQKLVLRFLMLLVERLERCITAQAPHTHPRSESAINCRYLEMTFTMLGVVHDSIYVLYYVVPTSMTMWSKPEPCLAKRDGCSRNSKSLTKKKEERWGLVFAYPTRLRILEERGYLTQFDSTHKVNKWRHNMRLSDVLPLRMGNRKRQGTMDVLKQYGSSGHWRTVAAVNILSPWAYGGESIGWRRTERGFQILGERDQGCCCSTCNSQPQEILERHRPWEL